MPSKLPIALVQDPSHPAVAETFDYLRAHGGRPVNIHRAVANSPEIVSKFVAFAWTLRLQSELDPAERELALVRVLERARGEYELKHHRRMGAAAGLSEGKIAALSAPDVDLATLTNREATLVKFVDAFCTGDGVEDDVQRAMKSLYSDRQIVELSLTLALYMGLAHFTNTLDVPID